MNTFLMWLGGLLIAVFALLFAGPYFVDWNSYRGVFEEEATRVLGRRVRVGGSVNVRLLPAPYLLFEDLRLADTTGIAGAPLFKIDSFKMWLAVPPLLKGAFEANKVELKRPVLALASDAQGYGNWRTLLEAKSLPFVPTGVKLDSVLIEDGAISYSVEGGGELTRVEQISGELTAQSLDGPYSFKGTAAVAGKVSDVRLLTTESGSDGSFRINATVSGGQRASDHKFDGTVRGLWDLPTVTGQLISKTMLAEPLADGGAPLIAEARSEVSASGQSLELGGITISLNDYAQPQIITGSMKAAWSRRHQVDLDLSSRWLDVDLMAGSLRGEAGGAPGQEAGDGIADTSSRVSAAPLPTARSLIAQLLDVFPDNTDVRARLDVDQVNLGGDRVANLLVAMERSGGPLELQTLRALLPGGARLNFSGNVTAVDGKPVFDGDLFIGGVSAEKIIRWASGSDDVQSLISDGPFSVSGRMQLGSNRVMLKSAVAEFSGVPIRGGMIWDDDKKSIDIDVEGYEIDTRWFGLGKLELPALADVLSVAAPALASEDGAAQQANDSGVAGWFGAQGRDLNLDLSAGRLSDGTTSLSDVEAQFKLSGERIEIKRVKLITEEGLSVRLNGALDGIGKTPKGVVDYLIGAKDRAAAWKLADVWAGDAAAPADRDRFAAFAPIRVAGRAALGIRKPTAADFTFDGNAGGGRIAGELSLDGGVADWHRSPVDFFVRSQAADTGQLFSSLSGGRSAARPTSEDVDSGNLLIKAVGTPENGLLTMMTLDSRRVSLVFDGKTAVSRDGVSSLSGELQLRDGDIRKVLRLAGLNVPGGVGDISYDGLADIEWVPGRLAFTPRDVTLSGARVGGRVILKTGEDGRQTFDGQLVADSGSLPRLLSMLLSEPGPQREAVQVARADAAGETATGAEGISDGAVVDTAPQIFSDRTFDLSTLDGVDGVISLKAGQLDVGAGMALERASVQMTATDGKLAVGLDGQQDIGGALKASLEITRAAAGAVSSGELELTNVDLAKLPYQAGVRSADGSFGTGRADLSLKFQGRGLSPRSMITVLTGTGRIKLGNAVFAGLAPDGIRQVAEATLQEENFSTDAVLSRLMAALPGGELKVGEQELAVEAADGAVQIAALDVQGEDGRTRVLTTVDLRSLVVDNEWRVVAEDPVLGRPWPPVVVSKVGPLQQLGAIEARITADSLERELAVRKMERNVNELERLRQLDEEAAARQRERERQLELESQRIEEERAAAAAAAARASGAAPEPGPVQLPDGWSAKPKVTPENGAATGDSPGAASSDPALGGAAASGTSGANPTEALPEPAASKRVRPKRKTKPKKKKIDLLDTQIFGF